MEFTRLMLYGALGLILVLLFVEWQAFQAAHQQPLSDPPRAAGADRPMPADTPGDWPDTAARTGGATAEGVEGLEADEGELPVYRPREEELQKSTPTSRRIYVTTDTLNVEIDPQGGDILKISLPQYLASKKQPEVPLVLLQDSPGHIYIAQSGLSGRDGLDRRGRERPVYESPQERYQAKRGEELVVPLEYRTESGLLIRKNFRFPPERYDFTVEYEIFNQGAAEWQGNFFAQLQHDGNKPDKRGGQLVALQPFLGMATRTEDKAYIKLPLRKIEKKGYRARAQGSWVAMLQHYFVSAWVPDASGLYEYSTQVTGRGRYIARLMGPSVAVAPGGSTRVAARFYAGPKDQKQLKALSPGLELTVDYGWFWWLSQPLFWLLTILHSLCGNWGGAIILLTVLVKLVFYPLSSASYRSMANMRRVQPQMESLRERYKEDRQTLSKEMMELYKKEKINPFGGCLPILIQMPVFIALYWVLVESVELRHAPFLLWVQDLSVHDPYFILPLLMGASMWYQTRMNPMPPDPIQAQLMRWMPVIFTIFFLWFPAGLVLYWLVNNLLSLAQQAWVFHRSGVTRKKTA